MKKLADKLKYSYITVLGVALSFIIVATLYYFSLDHSTEKPSIDYALANDQKAVFEPVLPGISLSLPQDFSFHNEFKQEGWNYFANLVGGDGEVYSLQWDYNRIARNESQKTGWNSAQVFLSNVIITSKDKVWKQQRIARGGIGQAGFRSRPFRLWIDNWSWRSLSLSPLPGILDVATDEFSLKLNSSSFNPFILNGESGYQAQHDLIPIATYGFNAPFVRTSGQLILDGKVVDVSGQASLSKEWGSDLVAVEGQKNVTINLHLSDGRNLQLTQSRIPNYPVYNYGLLVDRDGAMVRLSDDDIIMSAVEYVKMDNGREVPLKWKLSIKKLKLELSVSPLRKDLWHSFYNPYWQGPVSAIGTQVGHGMLKLTGF